MKNTTKINYLKSYHSNNATKYSLMRQPKFNQVDRHTIQSDSHTLKIYKNWMIFFKKKFLVTQIEIFLNLS